LLSYDGLKSQDLEKIANFAFFWRNDPLRRNFQIFHRDTDRHVVFKFREIDQCEVGEIVRCLPDKKFAWLSGSRYCADHTQSLPGPALDSVLSAPDFIQIGSLSVELSRTPEHRRNGSGRKVFPICLFG